MKATGEIVEVAYHGLGVYVDMNKWDEEYNFDEIIILDGGDPDYWTRLEHQAAIAAMPGMLAGTYYQGLSYDRIVEDAQYVAHALVEKYKKEADR